MDKVAFINAETLKKKAPEFRIGDLIKVSIKIVEGDRVRLQPFEGLVIGRRGSGIHQSFTVRRISYGEGVEKVFPLYSPMIDRIEVIKPGAVRRAKLHYLRHRVGKQTRETIT
ncbi:MAG: 50S ribosomal protein L19 [Candidatus Omnitrophica bacterium]|nr:50S ribosomal protein L19 [Candidatus Omnitrophota bacterium]